MRIVPAIVAKDTISRLFFSGSSSTEQLGQIQLRPHQSHGVARLLQALDRFHGALLCDEVGLGKTFSAAAVMAHFKSTVVIAPSGLLAMWKAALVQAGVDATLISVETFSRAAPAAGHFDLVVVDEAHHFRNPRTVRFRNVASYVRRSRVLLLTATPVHNTRNDITTLLSLFLGSRAGTLSTLDFSECVIRRKTSEIETLRLPRRVYFNDAAPPASESIRTQILGLPPPVPTRDGEYCATLVKFTLLRQWASSDAALRSGIEMRLARANALISALESGTYPTRRELSAWLTGGADIQLGFPGMLARPGGDRQLLDTVRKHLSAVMKLYRTLDQPGSSDEWRVNYLLRLRVKYPGQKLIAFTQFASTARILFRGIKTEPKVAVVTAGRCEIASGVVGRDYVIERFAPMGSRAKSPSLREEISLLISTDLCSEGLNLQDAGVVVHLDTPWTPARLEQRVGRIARQGSSHSEVMIHTLNIPVIADDLLRMRERLRGKSAIAQAMATVPEIAERVRLTLESWRHPSFAPGRTTDTLVGVVDATRDCFVAIAGDESQNILISGDSESVTDDPVRILASLESLLTTDSAASAEASVEIVERIDWWLKQHQLEHSLDIGSSALGSRRRLTIRINQVMRQFPVHLRAAASVRADRARRAMGMNYGAAEEERIAKLAQSQASGDSWLNEVSTIDESSQNTKAGSFHGSGFQLRALLIGRKSR